MTPDRMVDLLDTQATAIANLQAEVDRWGWIARWLAQSPDDITDAIEAWHDMKEQGNG